jgi:hypothetical protein
MNASEALDLIRFVPHFLSWLEQTASRFELPMREREWLQDAQTLLGDALSPAQVQAESARELPEQSLLRAEWISEQQGSWADALERLHAGVVFHAGSRAPLLESLFPPVKFASLRRARSEALKEFWEEFQRRAQSSYVQRQLAHPAHAPLLPSLEALTQAWQQLIEAQEKPALDEAAAEALRAAFVTTGTDLEIKLQQARHLSEAALLSVEGGAEWFQEAPRAKRRARASGTAATVTTATSASTP